MTYFVKITFPEPQEYAAINLAIATYEIMKPGMETFPFRIVPGLLGLVASIVVECGFATPISRLSVSPSRNLATASLSVSICPEFHPLK